VTRFRTLLSALVLGFAVASFIRPVAAGDLPEQLRIFRDPPPGEQAQILVLGTFHFADAGLDSYKPKHDVDILSPERQAELQAVLDRLEAWHPTKIAIEYRFEKQARLDSTYAAYLGGTMDLTSNEVHQIGFRLAKRLGLAKLHAVDAPTRSLYDVETDEAYEAKLAEGIERGLPSEVWNARLRALYAYDDSIKVLHTLRETFLYLNSPERLITGHGHYLIGDFQRSSDTEYIGPDLGIYWYVRNLRIFHNLVRVTESPDDRILLLIGAGHAPIITHAIEASPEYRLVPVGEVLGN